MNSFGPVAICLLFVARASVAAAPAASTAEAMVSRDDDRLHHTVIFLSALQLARLTLPSPLCRHLYVGLDDALDHLVDSTQWHELIATYMRSNLPEILRQLRLRGCNDNVYACSEGEPSSCGVMKQQGQVEIDAIESSQNARAVWHDRYMNRWLMYNRLGLAHACFASADGGAP